MSITWSWIFNKMSHIYMLHLYIFHIYNPPPPPLYIITTFFHFLQRHLYSLIQKPWNWLYSHTAIWMSLEKELRSWGINEARCKQIINYLVQSYLSEAWTGQDFIRCILAHIVYIILYEQSSIYTISFFRGTLSSNSLD